MKHKKKITTTFEKIPYMEFTKIANLEGRNISKMLEILVNHYKKTVLDDQEILINDKK